MITISWRGFAASFGRLQTRNRLGTQLPAALPNAPSDAVNSVILHSSSEFCIQRCGNE
jgi:hypothetical protein